MRTSTQEARRLRRRAIKEQNKASQGRGRLPMCEAIQVVKDNDNKPVGEA